MRIIGGMAGGLRLDSPRDRRTRPTADRVRESIFATLGDIRGARVADLYAGTGALGLEALSRGAEFAFFMERAPASVRLLRGNVERLLASFERQGVPAPEVRISVGDVREAAGRLPEFSGRFTVILADPPYGTARAPERGPEAVELLEAGAFADWAGAALLVLEHAAEVAATIATRPLWSVVKQKRYGRTAVSYLRRRR
ncbi:MAG: 16S rRNA (guanine(966)-N(2))-methyltransferase RsmD [Kiritimatiellaeota bacterium]|nr:16S rRNA (guanine(966)-N(2))-methyltransferase RsmD [Kiritimatiellota bacterium]